MKKHRVIGLMSGTSLDGLDIVYCHIWKKQQQWQFEIVKSHSISYSEKLKTTLKNAINLQAAELLMLHNWYGTWLGKQTKEFIQKFKLDVDVISSHGHTVHHLPLSGLTYQIGSGQHIANEVQHLVICDFRTNDVALGGQGAPLVPIGDLLLFDKYDFCLNLGGISNISFQHKNQRIAFDIGLANMILNYYTQKEGIPYDDGGKIAKEGKLIKSLLEALNELEYYELPFPKSTGYEWFQKEVIPIIEKHPDTLENLLHTAVHHICEKIAEVIHKYATKKNSSLLVTGGGALNSF